MIHQAGVTLVASRSLFGRSSGTPLAISGLAAAAEPPRRRRSLLAFVGGAIVIFALIFCLGHVYAVGATMLVVGCAIAVHAYRRDRAAFLKAWEIWESTWCCKACGTRWRGGLVYRADVKPT